MTLFPSSAAFLQFARNHDADLTNCLVDTVKTQQVLFTIKFFCDDANVDKAKALSYAKGIIQKGEKNQRGRKRKITKRTKAALKFVRELEPGSERVAPGRAHTAGQLCVYGLLLPDERDAPGRGHKAGRWCVLRLLLPDERVAPGREEQS